MRNFCYAAIGVLLLLLGCNISDLDFDNLKVENLSSDIAVPFGTAIYTFQELVEDLEDSENYEVDSETGQIRFIYRDTVEYDFSADLVDVPDNSESSDLNMPNATGPVAYAETINFTQPYVAQEGEILDSVYHEATASVQVTVSSTSIHNINYTLTLVNTVDVTTSNPMVFNGALTGGASAPQTQSLANYKTILQEVGGENLYNLSINLTANLGVGEDINMDQVSVVVEFLGQEFRILFGKMGRDTVDFTTQTLNIGFFQDFGGEGIEFGGATMTFDVTNSFGIPIGLGLGGVYGEENDGTRTYLGGSAVLNPLVIQPATLNEPALTPAETQTVLEINSNNSTLGQLLGTSPSTIGFEVQGITNTQDVDASNFVTDDAEIDAFIEIDIPLEVALRDAQHTMEFEIPGGVDLGEVDSLELRLVTVNELPFNATLDMYIMGDTLGDMSVTDTLYQVLDKRALDQPFLNFDRTVREPKIAVEDIPLSEKGTAELARAEVIQIVVTMNSPESQTSEDIFVKLLSTARIEVTLGVRGIIDVKL